MSLDKLFDPAALLLVVGGTILATLFRCGREEIAHAAQMLRALLRKRFSEQRVRGALAIQAQKISAEGLLRAQLVRIADKELADGIASMFDARSVDALTHHHSLQRLHRERVAADAENVFNLAADLAPVFGLAGTLIALTQLPAAGLAPEAISGAVSSAVLTTLYGVLSANLLFAPLARKVSRVAASEEIERQATLDWFMGQIAIGQPVQSSPSSSGARVQRLRSA